MSTTYSKPVTYHCLNDCRQEGCPAHNLRAVHHNTSDVLCFEIDGKKEYWFDYNLFKAMIRAYLEDSDPVNF